LDCGRRDFEAVLREFDFLFFPDPSVDGSVLAFYVDEFLAASKLKLYCLVPWSQS
jgi:hypothetical protein